MNKLIEEPQKPGDNECCGGGSCCPCVWDDYFDKMRQWRQQCAEQQLDLKSE